jgi:hypothetical protein
MFLDPIPVATLRYAFDNWNRNGEFFPKPKNIGDLVQAYSVDSKGTGWKCDAECQARHGKGYHSNDMLWLFKRMEKEIAAGRKVDSAALMDELDRKRAGGAPEWRVGA